MPEDSTGTVEHQRGHAKKGVLTRKREEVDVEGLLIARAWDGAGRILALGLSMAGETELRIQYRDLNELARHVRKRVRLTGRLHPMYSSIRVTDFEVLEATRPTRPEQTRSGR